MKKLNAIFMIVILFIPALVLAEINVAAPWIAAPPPGSNVLVAYMEIQNTSDQDRTLVSVSAAEFEEVQMHRSGMHDGMMMMDQLDAITIPANAMVKLASRGLHLMLMSPARYFKAGEVIELDLMFEDKQTLKIHVPVKKR
ncbi:MAG: copper chaperone PCu(A)C [Pseudomonadales bacterium]|nr:copper chaperone PCu(A)C [Pseudomonadales bacterium]